MSPEWRDAVACACPRPTGDRSAMQAVIDWCIQTKGDTRAKWIIESNSGEEGGTSVGRALRAGGWNGLELGSLSEILDSDPHRFVAEFLKKKTS